MSIFKRNISLKRMLMPVEVVYISFDMIKIFKIQVSSLP